MRSFNQIICSYGLVPISSTTSSTKIMNPAALLFSLLLLACWRVADQVQLLPELSRGSPVIEEKGPINATAEANSSSRQRCAGLHIENYNWMMKKISRKSSSGAGKGGGKTGGGGSQSIRQPRSSKNSSPPTTPQSQLRSSLSRIAVACILLCLALD